jgi:outer membrane protein OmpA-like peptidoglycan-associated protein
MKKCFLLPFLIFLVWSVFSLWYYSCVLRHRCGCADKTTAATTKVTPTVKTTPSNIALQPLQWYNNGAAAGVCNRNFDFNTYRNTLKAPMDTTQINFLNQVATYSKTNPQTQIRIDGLYTNAEKDSMVAGYPNVGYARAGYIKNQLVSMGCNANNLITNDSLVGGITNSFIYINGKTLSMAEGIKNNGFTIKLEGESFASGSSKFNPSAQFNTEIDSLLSYQAQLTGKKINIVGHTDNTGKEEANYKLGLARADAIRYYMVQKGVKLEITTDSKASAVPIADNATDAGKRLNRRVEIEFN